MYERDPPETIHVKDRRTVEAWADGALAQTAFFYASGRLLLPPAHRGHWITVTSQ